MFGFKNRIIVCVMKPHYKISYTDRYTEEILYRDCNFYSIVSVGVCCKVVHDNDICSNGLKDQ